jgi:hypothetical protein
MGEGSGGGDATERVDDYAVHAFKIFQDLIVPKPQNAIALALQKRSPLGFSQRRAIMLATIDFYNQPDLVAHKICNITADRYRRRNFWPIILWERNIRQIRFSASVIFWRKERARAYAPSTGCFFMA